MRWADTFRLSRRRWPTPSSTRHRRTRSSRRTSVSMSNGPLDPGAWMPEIKQVSFDIVKRGLQQIIAKELLNVTVDVYDEEALNYVAIRMTQRMLAHTA